MCATSRLASGTIQQADSVYKRRAKLLNAMEIAGKDIKITDHILGEGVTGKVYFADCYGFNAAAKVIVCLGGKVFGVDYTMGSILEGLCTCPEPKKKFFCFVAFVAAANSRS